MRLNFHFSIKRKYPLQIIRTRNPAAGGISPASALIPLPRNTTPQPQDKRRPEPDHETPEARQQRLAREGEAIDAALASAAAGRTVSFESVKAWVDSWDTDHELPQPRSGR